MKFLRFSWLILIWFGLAGQVSAITSPGTVVFTEDFSTDLSKWQITRGSPTIWQVVAGVLEGNLLTTSTLSELVPKPEYWSADWQNYSFELDIQPIVGVDRNLAWGYQNPLNWYEIHFLPDFFQLAKLMNGQLAWSQSSDFNRLTSGSWHNLRIDTAGGQILVWLDGWKVTEVTDSMYQENLGTIALKIGSGSVAPVKMRFDNLKVTLLADPRDVDLGVLDVSQVDPVWANDLYDSALDWAGSEISTISRWGCALTSAVMILRYYGFEQLTPDLALTPASLNDWLKSQPDGYIGQGWVNWLAIVRLSRELRSVWSTMTKPLPQLKYSYQAWQNWLTEGKVAIQAELKNQRPAILELPGHFVVAQGLTGPSSEILINDPVKSKVNLTDLGLTPISARLWQASYDLAPIYSRYWLAKIPKGLRLKVSTPNGELIAHSWISQDLPGGDVTTASLNSDWQVMVWSDPPLGGFSLELDLATGDPALDGGIFPVASLPKWLPIDLEFWVYDDQTNPSKVNLKTDLGQDKAFWWLETSQTDAPVIFPGLDWVEWRRVGKSLYDDGLLPGITWARADYLASLAEIMAQLPANTNPDLISVRYANWLSQILSQAEQKISSDQQLSVQQIEMLAAVSHWRRLLVARWSQSN